MEFPFDDEPEAFLLFYAGLGPHLRGRPSSRANHTGTIKNLSNAFPALPQTETPEQDGCDTHLGFGAGPGRAELPETRQNTSSLTGLADDIHVIRQFQEALPDPGFKAMEQWVSAIIGGKGGRGVPPQKRKQLVPPSPALNPLSN